MRPLIVIACCLAVLLAAFPFTSGAQEPAQYRLGPGDKLRVTVFGQPDLSGEFQVDGAGAISLPLIGEVKAGNRTLRELEAGITDALKPDYLKNPRFIESETKGHLAIPGGLRFAASGNADV